MTFFHRDKNSATSRANLSTSAQRSLDRRAIVGKIDNLGAEMHEIVRRSRPEKLDRVFSCNRAGSRIGVRAFHQMIRASPVAMTIEQSADDSPAEYSRKRFVFLLRLPIRDDFITFDETADVQAIRIRWAATKACVVRRVFFLKGLLAHSDRGARR